MYADTAFLQSFKAEIYGKQILFSNIIAAYTPSSNNHILLCCHGTLIHILTKIQIMPNDDHDILIEVGIPSIDIIDMNLFGQSTNAQSVYSDIRPLIQLIIFQ